MAAARQKRNPGIPLDMGWVRNTKVNLSATQRRATTLATRRSVKNDWQAAWLLRAITMIDLTTWRAMTRPARSRGSAPKRASPYAKTSSTRWTWTNCA